MKTKFPVYSENARTSLRQPVCEDQDMPEKVSFFEKYAPTFKDARSIKGYLEEIIKEYVRDGSGWLDDIEDSTNMDRTLDILFYDNSTDKHVYLTVNAKIGVDIYGSYEPGDYFTPPSYPDEELSVDIVELLDVMGEDEEDYTDEVAKASNIPRGTLDDAYPDRYRKEFEILDCDFSGGSTLKEICLRRDL